MYNFDTVIDRAGTASVKWDVKEGELPMWVADMDFQTAPEIIEALKKRVEHGVFGYTAVSDEWRRAVCGWWESRHQFKIENDWLLFCTGVIPVLSTAVRRFAAPGDNVLVLSPVYNHFYISIEDNDRRALESRLIYDGSGYTVDWADFEAKLSDPKTTLLIPSNPNNPTGNIWDRETLGRIGALCKTHRVVVVADEIHCDLTDPGYEYVPYASVSEDCAEGSITCIAPTKAFNIAGVQTAAAVVPNEELRKKLKKALICGDVAEPSAFAIDAAVAAFSEGGPWLDALRQYLAENKALIGDFIKNNLPQVKVTPSHATYLVWLDFSRITEDGRAFCDFLRRETGLFLNMGQIYRGNGGSFARLNAACPRVCIEDAMERLKRGVEAFEGGKN